jgi:adenine-specific DNA-methyltransferase
MDEILRFQREYEAMSSPEERKRKGQFFTPPEICRFMAGLITVPSKQNFRLLDPGAGVGSLSAAVCERISQSPSPCSLEIHLFENDSQILPHLRHTMQWCQDLLQRRGHTLSFHLHGGEDFILDAAANVFGERPLFGSSDPIGQFDAVIMNPPYFKINKTSEYAVVMEDVVHGQPNIYALFLAAAAKMVRPGGEVIAITPRSFCNGLYFREFRRWFFSRMSLEHIHLFESRTDTFHEVLQENLITVSRQGEQSPEIRLTTSVGRDLSGIRGRDLPSDTVLVVDGSGDLIVRIPADPEDSRIVAIVESWPSRFVDLGLRVSTGPVVSFRVRDFLLFEVNGEDAVPLLSVHNIKPFLTVWPSLKSKHAVAIRNCPESRRHLVLARNYVLLRRFSAKEEKRRLTASWFLGSKENYSLVGLENHLNYVYHADRDLTLEETKGVTALFNSSLLDRYFRTISGNTQVNATELRAMRFPDLKSIARIGKRIDAAPAVTDREVEKVVFEELDIDYGLLHQASDQPLF